MGLWSHYGVLLFLCAVLCCSVLCCVVLRCAVRLIKYHPDDPDPPRVVPLSLRMVHCVCQMARKNKVLNPLSLRKVHSVCQVASNNKVLNPGISSCTSGKPQDAKH
jgi:hypothetical protein